MWAFLDLEPLVLAAITVLISVPVPVTVARSAEKGAEMRQIWIAWKANICNCKLHFTGFVVYNKKAQHS